MMSAVSAGSDVERVKREVEEIIGLDCSDAIQCSAKMVGVPLAVRAGIRLLLHHTVQRHD
jgi:translation elongation factor EF-4